MEKTNNTKKAPRETLMNKDLVGFETTEGSEPAASQSGVTKSGKSMPGKAAQPSWARG